VPQVKLLGVKVFWHAKQTFVQRKVKSDFFDDMVKSSTILKYGGQYGFLVGAIGWIGNSVYHLSQGLLSWNWDSNEIIFSGIVGLFHLLAFLYLRNKFIVVELGGQKVRIHKDDEVIETNWSNVESVDRLIFSTPPIYTIRLKNINRLFIFWDSEIIFFGFDKTELGEIISKKKRDFDI
jgi:hypothetical protein